MDEAFFLGGLPKTEILRAFRPYIFFDDQKVHYKPASKVVSTGRVPGQTANHPNVVDEDKQRPPSQK